MPQAHPT